MKGKECRMGLEGVKNKKLLYHLTKADNMDMIVNKLSEKERNWV